ncbi:LysE family translocator [Mesobaculum littorinae]|uniref:LysE family translocator n=1 Tax=Mesobaculum littorinae TaxID=2486419 RepID=A0A438AGB6_9RHOB|nr:LysE family translocator [Mesobaculum littorinae]RVV97734.1 LysE family translocator [Mesobaculum littorinae]
MPSLETLLAMCGFALASSATPGPVNIIGAMTGATHGAPRALRFVSGATASFLALLVIVGSGMLIGAEWVLAFAWPMTLAGSAYLLWMACGLLRGGGGHPADSDARVPGFWSGVVVQGLNPKAWLAVFSSISTFVLPLEDRFTGMAVFTILFGAICWFSLAAWAWGGSRIGQSQMRVFNGIMALILALSVAWMLVQAVP